MDWFFYEWGKTVLDLCACLDSLGLCTLAFSLVFHSFLLKNPFRSELITLITSNQNPNPQWRVLHCWGRSSPLQVWYFSCLVCGRLPPILAYWIHIPTADPWTFPVHMPPCNRKIMHTASNLANSTNVVCIHVHQYTDFMHAFPQLSFSVLKNTGLQSALLASIFCACAAHFPFTF